MGQARRDVVRTVQEETGGRLTRPRVQADALRGMPDHYKIKLRSAGYRLVYHVEDERVTVVVVAIGRRERSEIYETSKKR